MQQRATVLSLYRSILRTAQHWPSVRKASIIQEIRDEFRRNASEAEPAKLEKMVGEARAGLSSLRQQCGLAGPGEVAYAYDEALSRGRGPPR